VADVVLSQVCRDPGKRGQRHPGCSGGVCNCPCHGVRPPANFRALVAARKRTAAESSPGDVGTLPGLARTDAP